MGKTIKKDYTICLDKLKINATGKIPQLQNDLTNSSVKEVYDLNDRTTIMRNRKNRNSNFNYCFDLILNGVRVCYFFADQKQTARFSTNHIVRLHVYNSELYTNKLGEKLNFVFEDLNLVFRNYFEIHISIDGPGLIKRHNEFSKSLIYKRNSDINHQPGFNEKTKEFNYSVLGAGKSEKQISFYPKEKELNQLSKKESKEYIREFWLINELIPADDLIDRVELRLSDKLTRGITSDFLLLESPVYLASVFKRETNRALEFKMIDNPEIRINIIDWNKFTTIEIKKKNENKQIGTLSHIKTTLRTIFEDYLETQNEETLKMLCDLSERKLMNDWVFERHEKWLRTLRINLPANKKDNESE